MSPINAKLVLFLIDNGPSGVERLQAQFAPKMEIEEIRALLKKCVGIKRYTTGKWVVDKTRLLKRVIQAEYL